MDFQNFLYMMHFKTDLIYISNKNQNFIESMNINLIVYQIQFWFYVLCYSSKIVITSIYLFILCKIKSSNKCIFFTKCRINIIHFDLTDICKNIENSNVKCILLVLQYLHKTTVHIFFFKRAKRKCLHHLSDTIVIVFRKEKSV